MIIPTLFPDWRKGVPKEWVIFATTAYSDEHVRSELTVAGVRFKPLAGRYDDCEETSWIVSASDFPNVAYLAEGETCVLLLVPPTELLDPLGLGWRGYLTDIHTSRRRYLGKLVEASGEAALSATACTYDPSQHRWWLVQ